MQRDETNRVDDHNCKTRVLGWRNLHTTTPVQCKTLRSDCDAEKSDRDKYENDLIIRKLFSQDTNDEGMIQRITKMNLLFMIWSTGLRKLTTRAGSSIL